MTVAINDKPEHLYKFRALDNGSTQYTFDIIRNRALWFSRPLAFNDPFDCVPVVSSAATDAEFKAYLDRLFKQQNPEMSRTSRRSAISDILKDPKRRHDGDVVKKMFKDTVEKAINSAGVLSLTSRYDHVLMWSHYASSHSGLCLRFRTRETSWIKSAQKVIYSADRPIMNVIRDEAKEMQRKAILTKADFWSYEEEWRIIDPIRGAGAHAYDPPDLDAIIFGKKTTQKHKDQVVALVSRFPHKIELLQSDIDSKQYRLVCTPI
jgi:hypothetical protein